jgi:hypothetical protein
MYALFYVAMPKSLRQQLEKFQELDDFLGVMGGVLAKKEMVNSAGHLKEKKWDFGIGILVVDKVSRQIESLKKASAFVL